MEIIPDAHKEAFHPTDTTTIYEYNSAHPTISGAIAEINGRYPETGFCVNQTIDEIAYVLSGQGILIGEKEEKEFSQGDVIIIPREKKYAWCGTMTLFMATTPRFDPNQHIEINE